MRRQMVLWLAGTVIALASLSLATAANAVGRPAANRVATVSDQTKSSQARLVQEPVLKTVQKSVEIVEGRGPAVTLAGEHFEPGATVRFESLFYVSTFSGSSVKVNSPTSLEIDPSNLAEGTYAVSVRNPSGRRSGELPLTVSRR